MKTWIEDKSEIQAILDRAPAGRLGLSLEDGPYVIPLNFAFSGGRIYFHTGLEGRKLGAIRSRKRVCFEVDEVLEIVPHEQACLFTTYYRSVIIEGVVRILEEESEKIRALGLLLDKYGKSGKYQPPPKQALALVNVCEITAERITAKANLPDASPG